MEINCDAFSLLAFALPHRHIRLGEQVTPCLSTSTADGKVIIRNYKVIVFCTKCKDNSYLVYLT